MTQQAGTPERASLEDLTGRARSIRTAYLREHSRQLLGWAGVAAAVGVLAIVIISAPATSPQDVLEATVRMERLAARLAHAPTVSPKTVTHLTELMNTPRYGCDQVLCGPDLAKRNHHARAQLRSALSRDVASRSESGATGK